MQLERFGVAIPKQNDRYFEITDVTLGTQSTTFTSTTAHFAPGEYLELTEQQKLSRPSFERMPSGLTLEGTQGITLGNSRALSVGYEQRVIDEGYASPVNDRNEVLSWETSLALDTLGASFASTPYQEPELGVGLQDTLYVIVNRDTLELEPAFVAIQDTYIKQVQRLGGLPSSQARQLDIVLAHEAA